MELNPVLKYTQRLSEVLKNHSQLEVFRGWSTKHDSRLQKIRQQLVYPEYFPANQLLSPYLEACRIGQSLKRKSWTQNESNLRSIINSLILAALDEISYHYARFYKVMDTVAYLQEEAFIYLDTSLLVERTIRQRNLLLNIFANNSQVQQIQVGSVRYRREGDAYFPTHSLGKEGYHLCLNNGCIIKVSAEFYHEVLTILSRRTLEGKNNGTEEKALQFNDTGSDELSAAIEWHKTGTFPQCDLPTYCQLAIFLDKYSTDTEWHRESVEYLNNSPRVSFNHLSQSDWTSFLEFIAQFESTTIYINKRAYPREFITNLAANGTFPLEYLGNQTVHCTLLSGQTAAIDFDFLCRFWPPLIHVKGSSDQAPGSTPECPLATDLSDDLFHLLYGFYKSNSLPEWPSLELLREASLYCDTCAAADPLTHQLKNAIRNTASVILAPDMSNSQTYWDSIANQLDTPWLIKQIKLSDSNKIWDRQHLENLARSHQVELYCDREDLCYPLKSGAMLRTPQRLFDKVLPPANTPPSKYDTALSHLTFTLGMASRPHDSFRDIQELKNIVTFCHEYASLEVALLLEEEEVLPYLHLLGSNLSEYLELYVKLQNPTVKAYIEERISRPIRSELQAGRPIVPSSEMGTALSLITTLNLQDLDLPTMDAVNNLNTFLDTYLTHPYTITNLNIKGIKIPSGIRLSTILMHCLELESLTLTVNQLDSISYLEQLKNLRELTLYQSLTFYFLKNEKIIFPSLPKLEKIHFKERSWKDLPDFTALPRLNCLIYEGEGTLTLPGPLLAQLKTFEAHCVGRDSLILDSYGELLMPKAETVRLVGCETPSGSLCIKAPELTTFTLQRSHIAVQLPDSRFVKCLSLVDTPHIPEMPLHNVKTLFLSSKSDKNISNFVPRIKRLKLCLNGVGDWTLKGLQQLETITFQLSHMNTNYNISLDDLPNLWRINRVKQGRGRHGTINPAITNCPLLPEGLTISKEDYEGLKEAASLQMQPPLTEQTAINLETNNSPLLPESLTVSEEDYERPKEAAPLQTQPPRTERTKTLWQSFLDHRRKVAAIALTVSMIGFLAYRRFRQSFSSITR